MQTRCHVTYCMWHFTSHPFVIKKKIIYRKYHDVSFWFIQIRTSARTSSKKRIEWMVFNHLGSMYFYYYRWEDKSNFNNITYFFKKVYVCTFGHVIVSYIYIVFTYVRTLNTTIRTKQMITIHYIQRLVYMTCYLTTGFERRCQFLPITHYSIFLFKFSLILIFFHLNDFNDFKMSRHKDKKFNTLLKSIKIIKIKSSEKMYTVYSHLINLKIIRK